MANNEAKIKFTAETGAFNDAIKKADSTMKELRAELKLNEAQMKNTGTSVEGLEKKHELLENQLSTSSSKIDALSGKLDAAIRNYGEGSTEVDKYRTQLINAQTAHEKLKTSVEQSRSELEDFKTSNTDTRTATEKLSDAIDAQETELNQLKSKYSNLILEQQDGSDEAQNLAREIENLSSELSDNKQKLADAADAADKLDKSFDDAGDAAQNSGDGFTVAGGVIADLASNAIQMAVGKVSEFIDYLGQLPEATRELRQDMATLETSFEDVGFTTEQATNTWKDLYTVFGEDDRAVEAANLIAKMSDNQQDLNDWVTITQGIWGSYQDSLPVEGLAEASMETAKTGTVTGNLADALNWSSEAAAMFADYMGGDVVTAEDAFNVALSECSTEQERQQLITETLTALYGDAAKKYEEASGAQLEAKEATAESTLAQNDLATAIEPVTTAWEGLKTELLVGILPVVESVSGVMTDALGWMKEHPVATKAIAAAVGVLAVGISALIIVVTAWTVAQWALNSAILANPITWIIVGIVAAIAAVVAIIVVVIEYWDKIVEAVQSACDAVVSALTTAWEWIKTTFSTVAEWFNTNVIQPVAEFFTGLWEGISSAASTAWDTICSVIQVAIMFIGEILTTAFEIITLPYRFIWENCKEYVFAAWEWIKEKVSAAITAVKNTIIKVMTTIKTFISNIWNSIKSVTSTVWNAIKSVVSSVWNSISSVVNSAITTVKSVISSVWNSIKSTTSTIWNGIKTVISSVWTGIKTNVSGAINGVKSTISTGLNSAKSTITNILNSIKSKFTSIFDTVKTTVSNAIEKIKGYFNFSWSLPSIKLPHFSISGSFSLNPPSIPKFSVSWWKDGGIMMNPTIFGVNGTELMAGGEAGPEAILPIDKLEGFISNVIENKMGVVNLQALADSIEDLANRAIELNINGRQFAYATAGDTDSVGGIRNTFKSRGLAVD